MTTQLTINLPDEIYHQVQQLATKSNRDVSDILADTIQWFLPLVNLQSQFQDPISVLSDEQLLTLTELQMEADQDQKLSNLLVRSCYNCQQYFLSYEDLCGQLSS